MTYLMVLKTESILQMRSQGEDSISMQSNCNLNIFDRKLSTMNKILEKVSLSKGKKGENRRYRLPELEGRRKDDDKTKDKKYQSQFNVSAGVYLTGFKGVIYRLFISHLYP